MKAAWRAYADRLAATEKQVRWVCAFNPNKVQPGYYEKICWENAVDHIYAFDGQRWNELKL